MRLIDLLEMGFSNLFRRKTRTILTIAGVIVGTASIVVMISLGLGLQKSSMEQMEKNGGLTTINVYNYGGATASSDKGNKITAEKISDEVIEKMRQIEHVECVSPILNIYVIARQGGYEGSFNIQGMTTEALQKMNIDVGKGELPKQDGILRLFYGNGVLSNFYNLKTREYFNELEKIPDSFNLFSKPVFVIFDMDAYWQSKNSSVSDQAVKPPKKYVIPTSGIMTGNMNEYKNNSYNVFAEIEALKAHLTKAFKNKVIPGQPTAAGGKPFKKFYYEQVYIKVDNLNHVSAVQNELSAMGYQADSNADWLKQTKEQMKTIQLVLGGIGAVSLFVASIGITNTMMMSIYERSKEIGVLKVLGCDLKDIRTVFLMEAGFIGFQGGISGLTVSGVISSIINAIAKKSADEYFSGISYIPIWLVFVSLFFVVLVSILAGLFPAIRAMGLSPLAAIRNEP